MKFALAYGYAISLALHAGLLLPLLAIKAEPLKKPSLLVVELRGVSGDTQSAEVLQRESQSAPQQPQQQDPPPLQLEARKPAPADTQTASEPPPPPKPPAAAAESSAPQADENKPREPQEAKSDPVDPPPPKAPGPEAPRVVKDAPPPQDSKPAETPQAAPQLLETATAPVPPAASGRDNVAGEETPRESKTLADAAKDADRLKAYSAALIKKVQRNLAYPDAGRKAGIHGVARVAFMLEASGAIRPGSLRIVESTGQPALDASALKTLRNSEPFDPPPRPMSVVIAVAYGRRN